MSSVREDCWCLKGPEKETDDALSALCSQSTDVYLLAKQEHFGSGWLHLINSDFISVSSFAPRI